MTGLVDDQLLEHMHELSAEHDREEEEEVRDTHSKVTAASLANLFNAADLGLITQKDMVVMPAHYARFKIEPIRFAVENNLNPLQFNIVKYTLRFDAKNGLEDLKKARRCLDMLIEFVSGNPDWWKRPEEWKQRVPA